jgi:predicted nucleic acid-binding protein
VLDASALVRAIVRPEEPGAVEWVRRAQQGAVRAVVPDIAYAEVANALSKYARAGMLSAVEAEDALDYVVDLPLENRPSRFLARQALALALTRGVSAYDACYLALAIGYDAMLVTADRRLAEHAERSALLPEQGPPG